MQIRDSVRRRAFFPRQLRVYCRQCVGPRTPLLSLQAQRLRARLRPPLSFLAEAPMGKRIYVGNLSYDVTDSALEQMFAEYGTVESAQVVMDRDTGRSKGFGFVEMK